MSEKVISGKYNILDDEEALKELTDTGIPRGEIEDIIEHIKRDEKKETGEFP